MNTAHAKKTKATLEGALRTPTNNILYVYNIIVCVATPIHTFHVPLTPEARLYIIYKFLCTNLFKTS